MLLLSCAFLNSSEQPETRWSIVSSCFLYFLHQDLVLVIAELNALVLSSSENPSDFGLLFLANLGLDAWLLFLLFIHS